MAGDQSRKPHPPGHPPPLNIPSVNPKHRPPLHHGANSLQAKQAGKKAPPPLHHGANSLQARRADRQVPPPLHRGGKMVQRAVEEDVAPFRQHIVMSAINEGRPTPETRDLYRLAAQLESRAEHGNITIFGHSDGVTGVGEPGRMQSPEQLAASLEGADCIVRKVILFGCNTAWVARNLSRILGQNIEVVGYAAKVAILSSGMPKIIKDDEPYSTDYGAVIFRAGSETGRGAAVDEDDRLGYVFSTDKVRLARDSRGM